MNREEAIKKLADIILDASMEGYLPYDTEDERCAMNIARRRIDELFPQFPGNLDDAAEEYEDWAESYNQSDFPTCVSFRQAFKAGAEWVTKQKEKAKWKPSEEQLDALKEASASWMNQEMGNCELLESLYNDLKKL